MANKRVVDQLGHEIICDKTFRRIVSTVPSQTETILHFIEPDRLIGRTKFCIHPKDKKDLVEKIGGTKNLQVDKIIDLQPDLIIANKEENTQEQIATLQNHAPCYVSDIKNMKDVFNMVNDLGILLNCEDQAEALISTIQKLKTTKPNGAKPKSVLYLIWKDPYMSVGGDTFIHSMLREAGFKNIHEFKTRYPICSLESFTDDPPDFVFLSSEPYPFKEKHIKAVQNELPHSKVLLVDGELFSWYGSRLLKSYPYFKQLRKELSL